METVGSTEVTLQIYIMDDDVRDIMMLAIDSEDGLQEWAHVDTTREEFIVNRGVKTDGEIAAEILLSGGGITIEDDENGTGRYVIFIKSLLDGIKMFLEDEANGVSYIEGGRFQTECIGATGASKIIEFAVFQ